MFVTSSTNNRVNSISLLLETLGGNYDSLPSVNTRSSIPISFRGLFANFPNYRRSFLPYQTNYRTSELIAMDEYSNYIENSPYPYGYEFEECFLKHKNKIYRQGKNQIDFVTERSKFIESYLHIIHVKYVLRSNTYIVTSSFDKKHRQVFFKQTNKLIAEVDGEVKWNSHIHLSHNFRRSILKHVHNVDGKLHTALSSISTSHKDFRTILNNPFWKETQATFLLNRNHKKLKRSCQYYFRKNKDYFEINKWFEGIPDHIVEQLKGTDHFGLDYIQSFKYAYDILLKEVPELATFEFINTRHWSFANHINATNGAFLTDPIFISFLKEYKDHYESLAQTYSEYQNLYSELSVLNSNFNYPYTMSNYKGTFKELKFDSTLHKNRHSTANILDKQKREVITLRDQSELVLNPTLEEVLRNADECFTLNIKSGSTPEFCLYKTHVYPSHESFLNDCSLSFIMENADVISPKIPDITFLLQRGVVPIKQMSSDVDDFPF